MSIAAVCLMSRFQGNVGQVYSVDHRGFLRWPETLNKEFKRFASLTSQ
jgi:hypothetical protein